MTGRRHATAQRLSLEVGFEPRHGSREVLGDAYERLLPLLKRDVASHPRTLLKEEVKDAVALEPPIPDEFRRAREGGDLRPRLHRPAG